MAYIPFLNNVYFAAKVGIGTETPNAKLEIVGGTSFRFRNATLDGFTLAQLNTNSWGISGLSSSMKFSIQNSDLYIPNGNVGIGTSTPSAKLDIQGTQGQLFSVTDNLSGEIFAVADISGVPIMSINSSGSIKFGSYSGTNQTGTPTYVLGTDATGNVVKVLGGNIPGGGGTVTGTGADQQMTYWTGSSVIDGDNGFRYNKSAVTPLLTLDASLNSAHYGIEFRQSGSFDASIKHRASSGEFEFTSGRNNSWGGDFRFIADTYDAYKIDRQNHRWSILGGQKMCINSLGNVGIGNTAPRTLLDVGSSANLGSVTNKVVSATFDIGFSTLNSLQYNVTAFIATTFGASATDIFASTSSETDKNFYTGIVSDNSFFNGSRYSVVQGGAERLVVARGGNVGIGTAGPSEKLEVAGGAAAILIDSTTNEASLKYENSTTTANIKLSNNDLKIELGGSQRMRINSQGQMWLGGSFTGADIANGNTSYLNNLNAGGFSILHRNAGDAYIHFNAYYNSSNNYIAKYAGTGMFFGFDPNTNNGYQIYKAPSVAAGAIQSFSQIMTIGYGSTNNVGIGTTSPDTKLHVVGPDGPVNPPNYSVFDVTIENSGQADLGIIGTQYSGVYFGDAATPLAGGVVYYHTDDSLTLRTGGNVHRVTISNAGAVKFNAYGAGYLKSDGSGNITAAGASQVGPFLPLSGGTMTGNIHLNDSIQVNFGGSNSAWEFQIYADSSNDAYIEKTATSVGDLVIRNQADNSDILFQSDNGSGGLSTYFQLDGSAADGTYTYTVWGDNDVIALGTGLDLKIFHDGSNSYISDTGAGDLLINSNGASLKLRVNSTENALEAVSNGAVFLFHNGLEKFATTDVGAGGIAVTGAATATTATTGTDVDATLTTKGYVDGLVTGVPVYKGTWDARTQAEGGLAGDGGNINLRLAANKVLGNYYIVSTAGSATPNGAGTEPDSWNVGDWCIFSDVTPGAGTDLWQKIDNSSVISGAGTGLSLTKWEGTLGAPSETLTDSLLKDTGTLSYTTSNSELFQLKGTTASGYAEIDIANNVDDKIVIGSIGSTYTPADWTGSTYIYNSGTNKKMYIKSIGNMQFFTGGYTIASNIRMTILGTNGNVGIGDNNPSSKLTVNGDIRIKEAVIGNQQNTTVDIGTEVVAEVSTASFTAAFFDFVIKKGLNVRSGTVYACHNGDTTPLIQFTETSTQDLGDTSDVVLSVVFGGGAMQLKATVTSNGWSVKSLIRAI